MGTLSKKCGGHFHAVFPDATGSKAQHGRFLPWAFPGGMMGPEKTFSTHEKNSTSGLYSG
jgi:hypothetical protein